MITNSTGGVKTQEQVVSTRQVGDVGRLGERRGNFPRSLDPPELNEAHASRGGGVRDQLSRLALSLSPNNGGPPLLLRLGHDELGALRLLLRHLLLLDRPRELRAVRQVRDGHIVEQDVEVLRPPNQGFANESGDVRPVGKELIGVELRNNGLHNLVANRREDLLVVLET